MDTYFAVISSAALMLLLTEILLGILVGFGIKGFQDDNQKLPRVHIALSSLPVFGFALSLPLNGGLQQSLIFSYTQIILFALGLVLCAYLLLKNQMKALAAAFVLAFSILGYFMIEYKGMRWAEPVGLGSYSLLDIILGLDLLRYLNETTMTLRAPNKNYLVLALHIFFQMVAVACAKEKGDFTFIALGVIGLFESALLCFMHLIVYVKKPEEPVLEPNKLAK